LRSDGTVASCGINSQYQLGHGDTTDRNLPTVIPGYFNVSYVSLGEQHSLFIIFGEVYTFGRNLVFLFFLTNFKGGTIGYRKHVGNTKYNKNNRFYECCESSRRSTSVSPHDK
jgi:alpha-tubulin suppressor-like RCC1 family protein